MAYILLKILIYGVVVIGAYSYCNVGTTIFSRVEIGKYCSIGYKT